jgi:hypothetical protein
VKILMKKLLALAVIITALAAGITFSSHSGSQDYAGDPPIGD